MLEKTGTVLEKFQQVEVGEPKGVDRHKSPFIGTVIDVVESSGIVVVEDQCGEAFPVDADNVAIMS